MPISSLRRALCLAPAASVAGPVVGGPVVPTANGRESLVLPNGMRIIACPLAGATRVAVQVWYGVGSRDDPPHRGGLAHLLEHLQFRRTAQFPDGAFQRFTASVGGECNAFTELDATAYVNQVPPEQLSRMLWMEAERLRGVVLDEEALDKERNVVLEEFRERQISSPTERVGDVTLRLLFGAHPYGRAVIGSMEELAGASLADVHTFRQRFYRPGNATLVLAGALDADSAFRKAEFFFSPLADPGTAVPRTALSVPTIAAGRSEHLALPSLSLPLVGLAWALPAPTPLDLAAMRLIKSWWGAEHGPLLSNRALRKALAGVEAQLVVAKEAVVLQLFAKANPGVTASTLKGLLETAVGSAHLTRSTFAALVARSTTAILEERQQPQNVATSLGWAQALEHGSQSSNPEIEQLDALHLSKAQSTLHAVLSKKPAAALCEGAK